MTAYKLLALDMDGTLLDSRKQVLPKTAAALESLAAAGVAVAFSTGRGLAELSDYVPNLPFIKYGSCISGGLVYDFSNQRTVFAHPFETKLALEVMAVTRQEAPMVHILTTTQSVAAAEAIPHMADFHMGIYQGMFDRQRGRGLQGQPLPPQRRVARAHPRAPGGGRPCRPACLRGGDVP